MSSMESDVKQEAIMLFSFGYWGWGNATAQLVQAFDALEQSRGFGPPLLVDCRISRSVRAQGFNNRALEKLVGPERYRHMPGLGNRAVLEHTGERVTIKNPDDAGVLLDLAVNATLNARRIVFFCSCEYLMEDGELRCHRYEVGSLLLQQSRKQDQPIVITEWPGTEPQTLKLTLTPEVLKKLRRGLKSVPLPADLPLDLIASVAWGSVVNCFGDGEPFSARVSRAMWRPAGWYLPVLRVLEGIGAVASQQETAARGFFERRADSA